MLKLNIHNLSIITPDYKFRHNYDIFRDTINVSFTSIIYIDFFGPQNLNFWNKNLKL